MILMFICRIDEEPSSPYWHMVDMYYRQMDGITQGGTFTLISLFF